MATKETAKTVKVGAFQFDMGLPVPEAKRGAAKTSAMNERLAAMPVGASFLEVVSVPETIKDEAERKKVFTETTRSVMNRISGSVRRFTKNHADHKFELRTVDDDVLGHGVRVYRIAVAANEAAAAA